MATAGPLQRRTYRGHVTDTDRWTNFHHRPDDIFICTPPKSGTTWTQAICAMLVFGTADHGQQPATISPWIDANFAPIEEYLAKIEAQTHRRYIKTHTPFDGIPYFSECTYIVVFRDLRDVYFSGGNHRDNMTNQDIATRAFPTGPNAFQDWLTGPWQEGTWDRFNVEALVQFFKSYWPYRNLPNVHFFHYADMKRDLKGAIAGMAKAIGIDLSPQQLESYVKAASFENMKSHANQYAPMPDGNIWKENAGFFASGANAQWKDKWSPAEQAAFDARIAELLPPDQVKWLMYGNG